jgi:DNA end-binding protein Ku
MIARAEHEKHPRASWKGHVVIDLVTFPVQAINALEPGEGKVHFHQLHATCHSRIHYQKVCPIHGEVSNDEIVSGYEYKKDRYVEFQPEELDRLHTTAERSFHVDTFIEPTQLDPMYFDGRTYFLVADGAEAIEPYSVLYLALERLNRWGVGEVVLAEREQLAVLRPNEGALTMSMLHHETQFRTPDDVGITRHRVPSKAVELAETMIKSSRARFDITRYEDRYNERLTELVEAKIRGHELPPPKEEERPEVLNLMDALRRSVARAKGEPEPTRPTRKRSKTSKKAS